MFDFCLVLTCDVSQILLLFPLDMTKRVPIRVEIVFVALIGSVPGGKEPWESRVCEWQGSRVAQGVCVTSRFSLQALYV